MSHDAPLFAPTPSVVGHRGAPHSHRENTPESFAAAVEQGATWVELDARLDADGEVVVHHDPTLADGRALIELHTDACLAAGVHTLADVLAQLPRGVGVDVEIKNFPGEPDHDDSMQVVHRTLAVLAEVPASGRRLITSFNPLVLIALADAGAEQPHGLLTVGIDLAGGIGTAVELGCAVLCPHHTTEGLDAEGIATAHGAGVQVLVWTVDDPGRARALAGAGADALCTNDPAAIGVALAG
jgi:glycerophosphoryl diester phosphodiesterase